jgi:hypothetical protein
MCGVTVLEREREEGESRPAAGPSAASWVSGGKGEGSERWAAGERNRPKREEGEKGRGLGWLFFSFSSFLFETNSILFEFK